ncbi:hypothetical protein [Steroidobacter agaridevorans]|uniref:hypothetical protein n=1 Tax=Steroidobacter agaridevorans TaxID=2695856 RepID=UPI001327129E|nr:hypothetical protein [Steroidobacter agaridevorans]GFE87810.1 hypothetical protein GCM10011488_27640 [Steroidobacter agaridevorans]
MLSANSTVAPAINARMVWPTGPSPGIYVAPSQGAIDAVIERYEREAPGEMMYCEAAGESAQTSIALGERGIFSNGLRRAPNGSLIILGPMDMTQESWEDCAARILCSSNLVDGANHRVVVLARTPSRMTLHADLALMLQLDEAPGYVDPTLRGRVSETGEFLEMDRFVEGPVRPVASPPIVPIVTVPPQIAGILKRALAYRPYGMIMVGSWGLGEHRHALLEAVIPLTDEVGPVARIQPNFRGEYGRGDSDLSVRCPDIPIYPSIESALAFGHRRIIIERPDAGGAAMLKAASHACLLVDAPAEDVSGAVLRTLPTTPRDGIRTLDVLTAVLCAGEIADVQGRHRIWDAYIARADLPPHGDSERDWDYVQNQRVLRWEDALEDLIARGIITREGAKSALDTMDVRKVLRADKGAKRPRHNSLTPRG